MPPRKKTSTRPTRDTGSTVTSTTGPADRKRIPPAGLEAHRVVREAPTVRHEFNPHLPPVLRFRGPVLIGENEAWRVRVRVVDLCGHESLTVPTEGGRRA